MEVKELIQIISKECAKHQGDYYSCSECPFDNHCLFAIAEPWELKETEAIAEKIKGVSVK